VEGAALLEAANDPAVALLRARLLHWAAPHRAEAIADAAHAAVLAAGDVAGQIAAARVRGLVAWRRGAPQLAVQHFQAGLALGLQHGQPAQRAILLDGLGLAMADLGDADGARAAFSEALALNDATGNDLQAVQNLINLSLDARLSAPARAQALAQRALALCLEIGFAHYQPHAQVALSLALSAGGRAEAARAAVDAALAAARQSGDDYAECWAGVALAQACRAAGDADGARAATHRGLGQAWRLGDASLMAQHLAEAGAPDDGRPLAQRVHEVLGRLA
jgi:tetratricopeptide (TPR) repeat protein